MDDKPTLDSRQLPLFPLSSVVMPEGLMPLRIFETRYVDMVRDCFRHGSGFVICPIKQGSEVGSAAQPYTVGCEVEITDWDQDERGLLTIVARGARKVRILSSRVLDSQLVVGEVIDLPLEIAEPVAQEHQLLQHAMEQILEQIAPTIHYDAPRLDDAVWLGSRFVELLPLPLEVRQELMLMNDPQERLQQLKSWLRALSQPGN